MDELLARVLAAHDEMLAIGNERIQGQGATFIRNQVLPGIRDANHAQVYGNTSLPGVRDANHVANVNGALDAVLNQAETVYEGLPFRAFYCHPDGPPALEARLAHDGYAADSILVMLLQGELQGAPAKCDIRAVETPAEWDAYRSLLHTDALEWESLAGRKYEPVVADAHFESRRIKAPAVRFWMAYAGGVPAAYLCSFSAPNGVGQVEDLFTHPDYRHRGLATALLHHCIADCRAHGAVEVFLTADPGDTPKHMYASLGFRPLAMLRNYWRSV